jgi:hypothetical protein
MLDTESDDSFISLNTISKQMVSVLDFLKKVDAIFKDFSDLINEQSSSIILYKKQVGPLKRHANDSNRSSDHGKKKNFCSNFSENDEYDSDYNNNNNNRPKKPVYQHKTCGYRNTDKEGRKEYLKGLTPLERHTLLMNYEIKQINILNEKEKRKAVAEGKCIDTPNKKKELKNKQVDITFDNNHNIIKATTDTSTDTPKFLVPPPSNNKHHRTKKPKYFETTDPEWVLVAISDPDNDTSTSKNNSNHNNKNDPPKHVPKYYPYDNPVDTNANDDNLSFELYSDTDINPPDDADHTVHTDRETKITKEKRQENENDHHPPASDPGAFEANTVLHVQNNN